MESSFFTLSYVFFFFFILYFCSFQRISFILSHFRAHFILSLFCSLSSIYHLSLSPLDFFPSPYLFSHTPGNARHVPIIRLYRNYNFVVLLNAGTLSLSLFFCFFLSSSLIHQKPPKQLSVILDENNNFNCPGHSTKVIKLLQFVVSQFQSVTVGKTMKNILFF